MSNHFNIKIDNSPSFKGYCYTGGICETNGYAIETCEGWVLIDAPEGFLSFIKSYDIDVKILMLTHQHFDHVMDAAAISAHFECPIWGFSPYDKTLTLENLFNLDSGPQLSVPEYTMSKILSEDDKEENGLIDGFNYKTIHVPGHSPDSICFYLKDLEILFGGDVLFNGSIGRTDFPNGDTNQLIEGIKNKIFPLKDEVIVFPGHGTETTIGEEKRNNPFLVS